MRKTLTQKTLDHLPPCQGKRYEMRDTILPGFMLRVSKSGSKVWYLVTRVHGRIRRIKIGTYPILSLVVARDKRPLLVRTIIVKIVAFASQLSFYLDNQLERVRSASELAFMHLQRLIVVDEDYRKKWQAAQVAHETHCEKLGAIHLMWHGVWAFKVDAVGGKTDLVYQEPPQYGTAPVALGVVLTEWKSTDDNPDAAYRAAKLQAANYSGGILAGLELRSHRYLVVVTKKQIIPPADIIDGAVVYRHINIAVEPDSPSVAAKKLATT